MGNSEQNPVPRARGPQPYKPGRTARVARAEPFRTSATRPLTITVAFFIAIVRAAWSVVNIAIVLITFNWAAFSQPGQARTFVSNGRTITMPSNISLGVTIGYQAFALVIAVLLALLALRLRQGGDRARIVFTVVGGFAVLGFVMSPGFDYGLLNAVAAVVFIVVVWLPPSNAYIRQAKAERAAYASRQFAP